MNTLRFDFDHLPGPVNMNHPGRYGARHRRSMGVHRVVKEMLTKRGDLPEEPYQRFEVHFLFYYPTLNDYDMENSRAASKPYIDALVKEGVLAKDDMKHLYRDYMDWEHRPDAPGFSIVITPADGGRLCPICWSNLEKHLGGLTDTAPSL